MLNWQRDKQAIVWAVILVLLVDVALSLFWTCQVGSERAQNGIDQHPGCGPFSGPVFAGVKWLFRQDGNPVIAAFTAALFVSTLLLWLATDKAAVAAKRSADAAYLAQRPWVNLRVEINGPLKYSDGQWSVRLKCYVANKGNSPANNVSVFAGFVYMHCSLSRQKTWQPPF
jgi:hypothetical protein